MRFIVMIRRPLRWYNRAWTRCLMRRWAGDGAAAPGPIAASSRRGRAGDFDILLF